MILGPIYIIPCPNCSFLGKRQTLKEGNNYGIELWSDGKKVGPLHPVFPILVMCEKCHTLFLALKTNSIDSVDPKLENQDKWPKTPFFKVPRFEDYCKAIGSIKNEKYLRLMIFRSFNDFIREDREADITEEIKNFHLSNLRALLNLFSENVFEEFFIVIEANRQLGNFEKCRNLLKNDKNMYDLYFKSLYLNEIERGNTKLFRLN